MAFACPLLRLPLSCPDYHSQFSKRTVCRSRTRCQGPGCGKMRARDRRHQRPSIIYSTRSWRVRRGCHSPPSSPASVAFFSKLLHPTVTEPEFGPNASQVTGSRMRPQVLLTSTADFRPYTCPATYQTSTQPVYQYVSGCFPLLRHQPFVGPAVRLQCGSIVTSLRRFDGMRKASRKDPLPPSRHQIGSMCSDLGISLLALSPICSRPHLPQGPRRPPQAPHRRRIVPSVCGDRPAQVRSLYLALCPVPSSSMLRYPPAF